MPSTLRNKVEELASVDKQFAAFGSMRHRYQLNTCATHADLLNAQGQIGSPLPESLTYLYLTFANGIAGPYYGLTPLQKLVGYRPAEPYPGIEAFRRMAEERGDASSETDYYELEHEHLTGLIAFVEQGCGHQLCVITNGINAGQVVDVSNEGFVRSRSVTPAGLFEEWVSRELNAFQRIREMMVNGDNYDTIREQSKADLKIIEPGDYIASIANVQHPVELFGEHRNRFHGAVQFPWYQRVLSDWQRAPATSSRCGR